MGFLQYKTSSYILKKIHFYKSAHMEEKYYAQASVPKEVRDEIIYLRNNALLKTGADIRTLDLKRYISSNFHLTIKAPFIMNTEQERLLFYEILEGYVQELESNVITIDSMYPPFGDWNEEVLRCTTIGDPNGIPNILAIALRVGFPKEVSKNIGYLKTSLVMEFFFDHPGLYTSLEQFNYSHISLMNNLQTNDRTQNVQFFEALYNNFHEYRTSFEIGTIDVMKKVTLGWEVDKKIPIPCYTK